MRLVNEQKKEGKEDGVQGLGFDVCVLGAEDLACGIQGFGV